MLVYEKTNISIIQISRFTDIEIRWQTEVPDALTTHMGDLPGGVPTRSTIFFIISNHWSHPIKKRRLLLRLQAILSGYCLKRYIKLRCVLVLLCRLVVLAVISVADLISDELSGIDNFYNTYYPKQ